MLPRAQSLLAALVVCSVISRVHAQQAPAKPGESPPAGVDKKYFDLSHSKDLKTKGLAERYLGLIRFQEWSTASGKTPVAKYISHDPDLKHVTLAVSQGTGKDRTLKEFNVDVASLSKVSQARLKQIDAIQKKLDELAVSDKSGDAAGFPTDTEIPGKVQGPEAAPHQPAAEQPDPSSSDPDPLGFAELQPVAASK